MQRVRINIGKVGVVSRNGDYKQVLTAGTHWIGLYDNVLTFDMASLYEADVKLDIQLRDERFAKLVEVVEVLDSEIALMYKGKLFKQVVKPGRYFYFKGLVEFQFVMVDLSKAYITESINKNLLESVSLSPYVRSFSVNNFEEALLFIDGKLSQKLGFGTYYFWKNSTKVELLRVDKRMRQLEISGQELLSRDKAALRINFFAQFKVVDAEKALLKNKDYEKQLYVFAQLALREFIGQKTLDEVLDNKEEISEFVLAKLEAKSAALGLETQDVGIRDVILPGDVKDIMNQVLIAQKAAQANIITRREETASTRSLLNTAKLMEDNTMLYKLKEMEYVERIADKIGEITVSGNGQVVDQLKQIFSK